MNNDFEHNETLTGCKKCGGIGYTRIDQHNVEVCECSKRDTLIARLKKANIPEIYFKKSLNHLDKELYGMIGEDPWKYDKKIDIHKYVKSYIHKLDKYYEQGMGICLFGKCGSAKTMICALILKYALWYNLYKKDAKAYSAYCITFKQLVGLVGQSWTDSEASDKLDYILNIDFLLIDEVGAEIQSGKKSDEFYRAELDNIVRTRYNKNLPTLLTSNLTEAELAEKYNVKKSIKYIEDANRIWSILNEKYLMISVVRDKGDFRIEKRKKMVSKIADTFKKEEKPITKKQ